MLVGSGSHNDELSFYEKKSLVNTGDASTLNESASEASINTSTNGSGQFYKSVDEAANASSTSTEHDPFVINLSLLFEEDDSFSPDDANECQSAAKAEEQKEFAEIHDYFQDVPVEYVESSQNCQGNYQSYVYRALKSILPLRKLNYSEILEAKKVVLPELPSEKKTLILDLDETLIHSDFDSVHANPDSVINFNYGDEEVCVPIFIRPGLFEFLQKVAEKFEILIFTASVQEYADAVLNYLDPENKFFQQRFYRKNCICVGSKVFIKDLRIFSNRKPENIIMVDNSLYSFTNQMSNGVLINSFYSDKDDKELLNVLNYLANYLQNIGDIRSVNEKIFNFNTIIDGMDINPGDTP